MTSDLITVHADEPLDAVIRRLLHRRISGVPVVGSDGTLIGVITEHDLLRWHAHTARARTDVTIPELLKTVRVSEVMSHLVVSVEGTLPLSSAIPILLELPYRRLPVTHHGRPVGIVSRADVLKALAAQDVAEIESTRAEATVGA
jgi:CBS domain-containing protein